MAVKAVILDLDGTLLSASDGTCQPGIQEMLATLRAVNLQLVVASNRGGALQKLRRAGISDYDLVLTKDLVGVNKGSPLWAKKVCDHFGVDLNEIIWLGDDQTDMTSAVNVSVVYFHAGWSDKPYLGYGINASTPGAFALITRECFAKAADWYWKLDAQDQRGRPVMMRTLLDAQGAGLPALMNDIRRFLKDGGNPSVGPLFLRDFIMLHLLGSLYADGIHLTTDTWTVYPGSNGGVNQAMGPLTNIFAKLFRNRYVEKLLTRHTPALDSGEARRRGIPITFANQIDTVCLDDAFRARVEGQRILVLDDFITEAFSFECARQLLLEAGAASVTTVAVGKYGFGLPRAHIIVPTAGYSWNPYVPTRHPPTAFSEVVMPGTRSDTALATFGQSYERVRSS